jgi:pantothenate kinase
MDGFHLAQAELGRLGRAARKGAPDTFDPFGYISLLERLRNQGSEIIYAPTFRRDLEEPIANAICVEADVRLVITEGNYLLLEQSPWDRVRDLLDESWFLDLDPAERVRRLVARHIAHGRSQAEAQQFVLTSDQANAFLVEPSSDRADLVIFGQGA